MLKCSAVFAAAHVLRLRQAADVDVLDCRQSHYSFHYHALDTASPHPLRPGLDETMARTALSRIAPKEIRYDSPKFRPSTSG